MKKMSHCIIKYSVNIHFLTFNSCLSYLLYRLMCIIGLVSKYYNLSLKLCC